MLPILRPVLAALGVSLLATTTLCGQSVAMRSPHQFPVSLALVVPGPTPPLVSTASMGFSLGYLYEVNRHIFVGAAGLGSGASLDIPDTTSIRITSYQMLAVVRMRLLRFGWSPYLDLEGGMAFYAPYDRTDEALRADPWLSTPRLTYGARVGVMVPLSSALDLDVAVRYGATPLHVETTTRSAHVGFVYHLAGSVRP